MTAPTEPGDIVERTPVMKNIIYEDASTELLDIIRANECESQVGSLVTQRFRAFWNEIERLRAALERLASSEAFTVPRVTNEEERARMFFAEAALKHGGGNG